MTSKRTPGASRPITIFRTGTFTSVEGRVVSFSADDLDAIVESYEPDSDPAPFVVGHPTMDAPAYGWAGGLLTDGEKLMAMPDRVDASFAELVNAGRFSKISASFYPPENPNNPKPGSWYLRHVGFLGAAAPAVKGLGTVSLSAADADLVTFDLGQVAATPKENDPMPDADKAKEASFAERETALKSREEAVAAAEKAAAEARAKAAHDANVSFAEGLVKEARLAPAGRPLLVGVMDALAPHGETVSFGEGDANQLTPLDGLKKLFEGAKPLVSFGEAAPADGKVSDRLDPADLAAEAVSFVESERKAGRTITTAQAVRKLSKKKEA